MKNHFEQNFEHLSKISFYVVAHADDWQLFMQPNVYNDLISPNCKVVIIVITGGDSGKSPIFWNAREEGSKSSIRFCLAPLGTLTEANHTRSFNSHQINYSIINNVTSFFLRLPDGNIDGRGFPKYNFQSLSRFKSKDIQSIHAIDGSSVYQSWSDFTSTIESILIHESEANTALQINYLNPDISKNHGDHIDHIMVGEAIQNIALIKKTNQFLYAGYSIGSQSEILQPTEMFYKISMFAAYEKTVYDICGYSTLGENPLIYRDWCIARSYCEITGTTLQ